MRGIRLQAVLACALTVGALSACSPAPDAGSPLRDALDPAEAHAAEGPPRAAPPSAARLDAGAREWVEETLAGLSLRQRVAQLVVPWISGESAAASPAEFRRMLRWVEDEEVGALIVSRGRPEAIAAKLDAAQERSRVPLLVVSDLETGPGMRLSPGGTRFPPAMAFGAAGDERLAFEAGRATAAEARAVGIHLTLGPVLDVNSNPLNPIINVRSFGEDPAGVARLASAWLRGAREGGLLAAGKHFPGHGDAEVDSHVGLATLRADSAELGRTALVPFRRAMREGMEGVLVGHIAVPAIDGPDAPPASLSERVVGDLLRGRLGFEGLVITDALNMGAVTRRHSVAEASLLALRAGADLLLQPPGTGEVIDALVEAVEEGRLPAERVEESARRVLRAKAAAGLHRGPRAGRGSLAESVGAAEHREVARRVAEAAVTLARDDAGLVPIGRSGGSVLHVVYTRSGRGSAGSTLEGELRGAGLRVERERVGDRTTTRSYDRLRERAGSAGLVLVTAAVAPHQYRALGVSEGFARFVEGLAAAGRPVVAVSLGSPYLLDAFPSVPAYLLAWSAHAASERAAARALLGAAPVRGRLPISIPPALAAGDGVER